jgi:hypothetical protein
LRIGVPGLESDHAIGKAMADEIPRKEIQTAEQEGGDNGGTRRTAGLENPQ